MSRQIKIAGESVSLRRLKAIICARIGERYFAFLMQTIAYDRDTFASILDKRVDFDSEEDVAMFFVSAFHEYQERIGAIKQAMN